MNEIIKDTLHPEKQNDVDIYPKTSLDQVVGYDEDKELLKQEISNTYAKKTDVEASITNVENEVETNYAKKTDIENSPLKEGVGKNSIVQKRQRTNGENVTSEAYQQNSIALGGGTVAGDKNGSPDDYSFAFAANENNEAPARGSAVFGRYNKSHNPGEFVCGNYAEENRNPQNVLTVGGGTIERRHNAFEVRTDHSTGTDISRAFVGGKTVATEEWANDNMVHREGNSYVVYINEGSGILSVMPYRFQKQSIIDSEYTLMFQPMYNGRMYSRDPIDDYHVANKKYVNSLLGNKLYRHEIMANTIWKLIVINNSSAEISSFMDLLPGKYISMYVGTPSGTPVVAVGLLSGGITSGIKVKYYENDLTTLSTIEYLDSNIQSDTVTTI